MTRQQVLLRDHIYRALKAQSYVPNLNKPYSRSAELKFWLRQASIQKATLKRLYARQHPRRSARIARLRWKRVLFQ